VFSRKKRSLGMGAARQSGAYDLMLDGGKEPDWGSSKKKRQHDLRGMKTENESFMSIEKKNGG